MIRCARVALAVVAIGLAAVGMLVMPAQAAHADDGAAAGQTWAGIAETMSAQLDEAWELYLDGDRQAARDRVNDAYYGHYEADGFERTVMAHLSGQAATDAEYEFGLIKKAILDGGPDASVREHIDTLEAMLA